MDPKQALLDALTAAQNGEYEQAKEFIEAYWGWRRSGGFEPQIDGATFATAVELLIQAVYV